MGYEGFNCSDLKPHGENNSHNNRDNLNLPANHDEKKGVFLFREGPKSWKNLELMRRHQQLIAGRQGSQNELEWQ